MFQETGWATDLESEPLRGAMFPDMHVGYTDDNTHRIIFTRRKATASVVAPLEAVLALCAQAKRVKAEVTGHGAVKVRWSSHSWDPCAAIRANLHGASSSWRSAHGGRLESHHGASHCIQN